MTILARGERLRAAEVSPGNMVRADISGGIRLRPTPVTDVVYTAGYRYAGTGTADVATARRSSPELKGSIGEGPNHSNHSNRSNHSNSFKIGIFPRNFKIFRELTQNFNIFEIIGEILTKISSKSEQNQ